MEIPYAQAQQARDLFLHFYGSKIGKPAQVLHSSEAGNADTTLSEMADEFAAILFPSSVVEGHVERKAGESERQNKAEKKAVRETDNEDDTAEVQAELEGNLRADSVEINASENGGEGVQSATIGNVTFSVADIQEFLFPRRVDPQYALKDAKGWFEEKRREQFMEKRKKKPTLRDVKMQMKPAGKVAVVQSMDSELVKEEKAVKTEGGEKGVEKVSGRDNTEKDGMVVEEGVQEQRAAEEKSQNLGIVIDQPHKDFICPPTPPGEA